MSESAEKTGPRAFRFKYILMFCALTLVVLALASHSKADLAVLEGGSTDAIRNWVGPLGAQLSRAVLYLFGLAAYPITAMLIIAIIRSFLPIPLKRPAGYAGAMLSVALGITILMAMWPEDFARYTDALGIGRQGLPGLALSGGVIGSHLAAPEMEYLPAGLIRAWIGVVGTGVVAGIFILAGLYFLFMADWKQIVFSAFSSGAQTLADGAQAYLEHQKEKKADKDNDDEVVTAPPATMSKPAAEPPVIHRPCVEPEEEDEKPDGTQTADSIPIRPPAGLNKVENASPVKVVYGDDTQTVKAAEDDPDDDYHPAPPAPLPGQAAMAMPAVVVQKPVQTAAEADTFVRIPVREPEEHIPEPPKAPETPKVQTHTDAPTIRLYSQEQERLDHQSPKTGSGGYGPGTDNCANYDLPPVSLLDKQKEAQNEDTEHLDSSREKLQETLDSFNVEGRISDIVVGPRVTRFEVSLQPGVKVEKVTGIQQNIAMDLAAESIRVLAPIPGKNTVGIEVPNKISSIVYIRALMESSTWKESRLSIPIILGRDIGGAVMVTDLAKAPHLLIAGSTGSGKSVCMNTLIMSLLFKFSPAQLRLILVDPKVVELEMYRPLPHLITPVVNDPKKVPLALRWGVNEMERRYKVLAKVKAKNLAAFNSRPPEPIPVFDDNNQVIPPKLPLLIIIIDELADIMMTEAKADVETSICRIAQKGRAAGIHLVIATQTPRKDVVTGLIKANLPTKIAFKVGSNMDSRVILDGGGAEKLLGYGDMLFKPPGASGLERIQGSMVSDPEIQRVVDFVSGQVDQHFDAQVIAEDVEIKNGKDQKDGDNDEDDDIATGQANSDFADSVAAKYLQPGDGDLVRRALEIVILENKVSTSYLQRRLGIGYNKSAEIIDVLEQRGIISGPLPGGQKREILVCDNLNQPE